jgi:hypothetical protein
VVDHIPVGQTALANDLSDVAEQALVPIEWDVHEVDPQQHVDAAHSGPSRYAEPNSINRAQSLPEPAEQRSTAGILDQRLLRRAAPGPRHAYDGNADGRSGPDGTFRGFSGAGREAGLWWRRARAPACPNGRSRSKAISGLDVLSAISLSKEKRDDPHVW